MTASAQSPSSARSNLKFLVRLIAFALPAMAWVLLVVLSIDLEVCRVALIDLENWLGIEAESTNWQLAPLLRPVVVFSASLHPFLLLWLMWSLMAVAMMLPTATAMLETYADLLQTAREKAVYAPSLLFMVAGYLTVWVAFAFLATILQILANGWMGRLPLDHAAWPAALAGGIFIAAGLWQFSPIKDACLTKCQNPFPIIFSRWRPQRWAVFRLGLEQGLYCLGCCWAMMMVMFAVGTMNLFWMALGALAMGWEKSSKNKLVPTIVSGVLIAIGMATLMAAALMSGLAN